MTITIDASTGLPELPEGHFWRIQHMTHDYYSGYSGYDTVQLQIRKTIERLDTVTERPRSWWRKAKYEYKTVTDSDLIKIKAWDSKDFLALDPETQRKNIDAYALQLADNYWTELERANNLKELVGDYPPKVLAVPSE